VHAGKDATTLEGVVAGPASPPSPHIPANMGTLSKGIIIGTVLQVAMVCTGHFVPQVAQLFPIVGTAIGGVAGWLATRGTGAPSGSAAGTGAAAGLISGVLGTLVSVGLGDVPMSTVAIAAGSTAVLGAVGGALGRGKARGANA